LFTLWRVGAVLTDYAGGVKKRNQSGTDYVFGITRRIGCDNGCVEAGGD
jgi:hypothetical protein